MGTKNINKVYFCKTVGLLVGFGQFEVGPNVSLTLKGCRPLN